jgi:hypothetical protein
MIKIWSKEKCFMMNGEKYYFSSLDKISVFHGFARTEYFFYKNDNATGSYDSFEIPPKLAQVLINMFHVQADFITSGSVHIEII